MEIKHRGVLLPSRLLRGSVTNSTPHAARLVNASKRTLKVEHSLLHDAQFTSGVARIWCEEGHGTKRKYYEIHAINMTKHLDWIE